MGREYKYFHTLVDAHILYIYAYLRKSQHKKEMYSMFLCVVHTQFVSFGSLQTKQSETLKTQDAEK